MPSDTKSVWAGEASVSPKNAPQQIMGAAYNTNPATQALKHTLLVANSPFRKSRWKEVVYVKTGGPNRWQKVFQSVLAAGFVILLADGLFHVENLDEATTLQVMVNGYPLAAWAIGTIVVLGTILALTTEETSVDRIERIPEEQYYPPKEYWETLSESESAALQEMRAD